MVASQLLDDTLIATARFHHYACYLPAFILAQNTDKDDALMWLRSQVENIFKREGV
ncbi:hypothetical protein ACOBV9_22335 (plasmid) [Pseudoalteromonas espejiana]